MSFRYPGGFVRPGYNPLLAPNAPTIEPATAGNGSATVAFTAPSNVGGGAISIYTAVSTPGQFTGSSATSPITVTGLTNGVSYTFQVLAINAYGPSDFSAASNSVTPAAPGTRGLFGGGLDPNNYVNTIDYIIIQTTGNATDFGDLTVSRTTAGSCSSDVRGVWAGGNDTIRFNVIDYVTIATTGNATDFGDLTSVANGVAGCGNITRGIFALSRDNTNPTNVINYITIATAGNALDFGDLTQIVFAPGACSSSTRGVFAGGFRAGNYSNIIDYVTISSTGNATDFGDLTRNAYSLSGCSSSTRGIFGPGDTDSGTTNVMDYITIASTGNATDFGDYSSNTYATASCSSDTRGVWAGGYDASASPSRVNVINYVTIASTGNSLDFGDLSVNREGAAGCSNGHGGLS